MARSKHTVSAGSLTKQDLALFAYNLYDDLIAFFESEDGNKEFEAWQQEQYSENTDT